MQVSNYFRGFITIPFAVTIAVSVIVGSGVGFGLFKYSQVASENERLALELENQDDIKNIEPSDNEPVDSVVDESDQLTASSTESEQELKQDDGEDESAISQDTMSLGQPSNAPTEPTTQANAPASTPEPVVQGESETLNSTYDSGDVNEESMVVTNEDSTENQTVDAESSSEASDDSGSVENQDEQIDWSEWNFHIYVYRNSVDNLESDRVVVNRNIETTKEWQVIFNLYSSSENKVIADVALRGYRESAELLRELENAKETIEESIRVNRQVQQAIRSEDAETLFELLDERELLMEQSEREMREYQEVYDRNVRIYEELENLTNF